MRHGYLRVSRKKQKIDRQKAGLKGHCDKFHIERLSAATVKNRPVFNKLLHSILKPGDALVIWDLDRAFRSAEDAIVQERLLREQGIKIEVVNGAIDTSTANGNRDFQNRAVNAEYERRIISERTIAGLREARKKGKRLGRPPIMSDKELRAAKKMIDAGRASRREIAEKYDIEPWTVTRAIQRFEKRL